MALTVSMVSETIFGNRRVRVADVTFDSSYGTGGEALTPDMLDFPTAIEYILPQDSGGYSFQFDATNKKLLAYRQTAHTHAVTLDTGATAAGSSHTHTATTKTLCLSFSATCKGAANTDSENTDQAAEPTNGHAVEAVTAVAAGAWTKGTLTNPDVPRNLCVVIANPTGGGLNLYEGVMTFTLTGTYLGAAQTETITFTSTAGNKSVAAAKYRYKYGVKPFDTVTNMTLDNVPANALTIAAGYGAKIGLPNALPTPAAADVRMATKNAAALDPTTVVNTTNNTVNMTSLSDNDTFAILYTVTPLVSAIAAESAHTHAYGTLAASASGSGGPSSSAAEVSAATNLSAVTTRLMAVGY